MLAPGDEVSKVFRNGEEEVKSRFSPPSAYSGNLALSTANSAGGVASGDSNTSATIAATTASVDVLNKTASLSPIPIGENEAEEIEFDVWETIPSPAYFLSARSSSYLSTLSWRAPTGAGSGGGGATASTTATSATAADESYYSEESALLPNNQIQHQNQRHGEGVGEPVGRQTSSTVGALLSPFYSLVDCLRQYQRSSNIRLKYLFRRTAVQPLPQILIPYKSLLLVSTLLIFCGIIVFNLAFVIAYGIQSEEVVKDPFETDGAAVNVLKSSLQTLNGGRVGRLYGNFVY